MKTFPILKAALVVLIAAAFCQNCHAQAQGQWWPAAANPGSDWSLEIGGKVFDRPGSDIGLPIATNSVTNEVLFDSNDASDLNGALAGEVKWNFKTKAGRQLEIRGQIARWEISESIADANLTVPFFLPAFDPDSFDYQYDSQYASIEILGRREMPRGFTLLGGFRYVSFMENVSFQSSTVFDTPAAPPVTVLTDSDVEARNHMFGLQIGAEFNRAVSRDLHLTSFIRIAALANPTRVEMSVFDDLSGVTTLSETSLSTGTGLFEFGSRLNYTFVRGGNFFLGYEGTFIDGIALAPAQLITSDLNGAVETSNTPYFGGLVFGLEYSF